MSFYDAIRVGASGAADFEVERSLRFARDDNHYLTRTPSSAGNRKTFTFSAWVKLGQTGINTTNDPGNGLFLSCGAGSTAANMTLRITNNGYIGVDYYGVGGYYSSDRLRDPSAWYHCVWVMDTTESTAANRFKVYVNGNLIYNNQLGLSQNADTPLNNNSATTIGAYSYNTSHVYRLDAYLAEVNFIDGQAYDPTYFAETNAATGQWNPKKYEGSYGTNGFYLKFSDNSGTTATTLGKDSSGNGNNFTPTNFAVSDSMIDTPTNNFATLNPIAEEGGTYTEGNLKLSAPSGYNGSDPATSTIAIGSGNFYFEAYVDTNQNQYVGVLAGDVGLDPGRQGGWGSHGAIAYRGDGQQYSLKIGSSSSITSYGASYTTGDIIGCAVDIDNDTVTFYKNGVSQGNTTNGVSYISATGAKNHLYAAIVYTNGGNNTYRVNFGQDGTFQGTVSAGGNTDANGIGNFKYTVPTGFKALCSANLPDPTILLPNQHFNTLLYTGNDSNSRDITGVGFQPDWLWIKNRSQADFHQLVDAVRGANKTVYSNDTDNEQTDNANGHVNSFLADGFNVDAGGSGNVNENNENYVAWNWNAGNSDGATYRVVVVSDSGNKYRFRNSANTTTFAQSAVTLNLAEGGTYIFNMDDSTNASHPFSIGTAANGTVYTSGITYFLDGVSKTYSQYTSGFASATTRRLHITVPASAPVLYYWCSAHSGMGGQINTNSTLGSTNFDGTSLAVVKANTTAGFSIVTYTGTGSSTTVGHGLGIAPKVVLTRSRSSGGSWGVLHTESNPTAEHRINLNDNGGFSSYQGYNIWADTVPTSSVFTVNSDATTNASSVTYVGYVFSEVSSYSKFGKYTGNGNADGTFVFTGFRPAWIMLKNVNTSTWWFIYDVKRETFNPQRTIFGANVADAEYPDNAYRIDILSNGFKIRGTQNETNKSGDTISYFSFAESPFKNARAR